MTADEIRKEIASRGMLEYRDTNGRNAMYWFMQHMFSTVECNAGMPVNVAKTLALLPDEEVEKHYEAWKLKYAQQQIEQEL